jgi:tetraacyldisaccharide 4'-kinase
MEIEKFPLWLRIPVSWLFALTLIFRDLLYQKNILKSARFDIPIICVGNIAAGGTGKTPMVEWIAAFLMNHIPVAVLSRGYGRRSSGFRLVQPGDSFTVSGDEPLQIKRKYPMLPVAVSVDRAFAIPRILMQHPDVKCIVMDDGLQHRAVVPGLSILMTTYHRPYHSDRLLPAGYLRDFPSVAGQADIIIVNKCPADLAEQEVTKWKADLSLKPNQQLYFTSIEYGTPYAWNNPEVRLPDLTGTDVLLLTGLADPTPLVHWTEDKANYVFSLEYDDHHAFHERDLANITRQYEQFSKEEGRIVLTTEKDAIRLEPYFNQLMEAEIPVFIVPIRHHFLFNGQIGFEDQLVSYLMNFTI